MSKPKVRLDADLNERLFSSDLKHAFGQGKYQNKTQLR